MKEEIIEKDKYRLEILEKIERLEMEGRFDEDAENDPPTIALTPDNIDYLKTKGRNKLKASFANGVGKVFLSELLRNNKLIIKEINGIENLQKVKSGAVITCNHFNPMDVFTVEKVFRESGQNREKKLYKVIREGNYTNFPGFYGFLFRNCDTLPLSSNKRTMVKFLEAVDIILRKGNFVLIYPEQSLWWNYTKPKPLKSGAFKMATKSNVPVIPMFITMKDTETIGNDGFPIKEYFVHIAEPIYPEEGIQSKQNIESMKEQNFNIWKNIYEKFYGIPLEYTTKTDVKKSE